MQPEEAELSYLEELYEFPEDVSFAVLDHICFYINASVNEALSKRVNSFS